MREKWETGCFQLILNTSFSTKATGRHKSTKHINSEEINSIPPKITIKAYVKQYQHLHLLSKYTQVFYLGRKHPLQAFLRVRKKSFIILVLCFSLKFKYTNGRGLLSCDRKSKLLAVSPSLHKTTNIYVTLAFLCIIFLPGRSTSLPLMIWKKFFSIYILSTKFAKPLFLLVLAFSVRLYNVTKWVQERQKNQKTLKFLKSCLFAKASATCSSNKF